MKRVIFLNRFFFPDHSATSQILTDLAFYLARSASIRTSSLVVSFMMTLMPVSLPRNSFTTSMSIGFPQPSLDEQRC
jgi:hypothetical protein